MAFHGMTMLLRFLDINNRVKCDLKDRLRDLPYHTLAYLGTRRKVCLLQMTSVQNLHTHDFELAD